MNIRVLFVRRPVGWVDGQVQAVEGLAPGFVVDLDEHRGKIRSLIRIG